MPVQVRKVIGVPREKEGSEEFSKGLDALVVVMGGHRGVERGAHPGAESDRDPKRGGESGEWLLAHEEWPLTWGRRRFPFL